MENNYEIYNKIFNMAYDIKLINEFYFSEPVELWKFFINRDMFGIFIIYYG